MPKSSSLSKSSSSSSSSSSDSLTDSHLASREKRVAAESTEVAAAAAAEEEEEDDDAKRSSEKALPKPPTKMQKVLGHFFPPAATSTRARRNVLRRVAQYRIPGTLVSLVLSQGSVADFSYKENASKSAIVNAANEGGLGGGGVDGAISKAGGDALLKDRKELPIVESFVDRFVANGKLYQEVVYVRIPTGRAKVTGPGEYGSLHVPFVIHAVGPIYPSFAASEYDQADALLQSAYREAIRLACECRVEGMAFSLLSAGVFRGRRSLKEVLGLGLDAICHELVAAVEAGAAEEEEGCSLREVHLCGFTPQEIKMLQVVAKERQLEPVEMEETQEEDEEVEEEAPTKIPADDEEKEEGKEEKKKMKKTKKKKTATTKLSTETTEETTGVETESTTAAKVEPMEEVALSEEKDSPDEPKKKEEEEEEDGAKVEGAPSEKKPASEAKVEL